MQDDRASDDLPFGSRGGISIPYHFPLDGDYSIKVVLRRQLYLYLIGMGEPHQIDVRLDGTLLKRFTIGGEGKGMTAPESFAGNTQGEPQWEEYMHTADAGLIVRVPVTAGTHQVGVSFVRRHWEPEGVLQPPQRGFARTTNELYFGNPSVDSVSIAGPSPARATTNSPAASQVFVCRPTSPAAEEPCARRILSTIARRAYRGPVSDERPHHAARLLPGRSRREGGFDAGIQRGCAASSRRRDFCFASSVSRAGAAQHGRATVSRQRSRPRVATVLLPVEQHSGRGTARRAATTGTLSNRATLERQVRRMLADRRAQALVDNFASQWLTIGKLAGVVPDVDAYPEFDENLREAFRQETRLFIGSQAARGSQRRRIC